MNWNNWSDFFHMGGYGLYVWGTFAVTAVVCIGELLQLHDRRKKASLQLDLAQEPYETTQ
jgi:heme exporter protein D